MGTSLFPLFCGFSHSRHQQSGVFSGVRLIGHAWHPLVTVWTLQYIHNFLFAWSFLFHLVVVVVSEVHAPKCVHCYIGSFSFASPLNWLCFQGNNDEEDVRNFTAHLPTLPWDFGKAVCEKQKRWLAVVRCCGVTQNLHWHHCGCCVVLRLAWVPCTWFLT